MATAAEGRANPSNAASGGDVEKVLLAFFAACHLLLLHYLFDARTAWLMTLLASGLLAPTALRWARDAWRAPRDRAWLHALPLLGLAILLCLLSGEAHVFYANWDWMIRDAVLSDLVAHSWPVAYGVRGVTLLLRAPIGMYLFPALMGKLLGPGTAQLALLGQNALLLFAILRGLTLAFEKPRQRWAAILVFTLFSGLDLPGQLLARARQGAVLLAPLPSHLEAWASLFQYSSHLTQLFWVPHHALAGWAFAAVALGVFRAGGSPLGLLALAALLPLWSPFAAMGAAPFALPALTRLDWRALRKRIAPLAALALLVAPALLYLQSDAGELERHLLTLDARFALDYLPFIALEVIVYLLFLGDGLREPLTLVAACVLLLIPFYQIGFSNDFVMRASIPALAILALAVAARVVEPSTPAGLRAALVAVLLVGAATPLFEIRAALTLPAWPASRCNLLNAWTQSPVGHRLIDSYLMRQTSFAAATLFQEGAPPLFALDLAQPCWPQPPVIRSWSPVATRPAR